MESRYNKVVLVGYVDSNVLLQDEDTDKMRVTFLISVKRYWGNLKSDERDVFRIIMEGRGAKSCAKYTKKGSLVLVEGELRSDLYEYKGEMQTHVSIIGNHVITLKGILDQQEQANK